MNPRCKHCDGDLEKYDDGTWKHIGGTQRCWLWAEPVERGE